MISRAEYYRELATAWRRHLWTPSRVREWQDGQLRRLIRHARANVPFYAKTLSEVDPERFRGAEDLGQLPLYEKADHQATPLADRLAKGVKPDDCIVLETSGATGEALRIHQLPYEAFVLYGRRLRAAMQAGLRPHHRRVNIGSQTRKLLAHRLGAFRVSALPLSARATELLADLERIRPEFLKLASSTLQEMLIADAGRLGALGLRGIFTGAEQLPQSIRAWGEEVSGCRITDFYGASECNLIAWECKQCGLYHTCDDGVVVEVVREDGAKAGPGEEGRIAITSLYLFGMPFIRYLIGDSVRVPAVRPDCDVGFGAIEGIEGRLIDYLRLKGGRQVSPQSMMDALDAVPGVRRYEAEQMTMTELVVRYEPSNGAQGESTGDQIRDHCYRLLPRDVAIEVERVEALPNDPASKRRFIRTRVPLDAE